MIDSNHGGSCLSGRKQSHIREETRGEKGAESWSDGTKKYRPWIPDCHRLSRHASRYKEDLRASLAAVLDKPMSASSRSSSSRSCLYWYRRSHPSAIPASHASRIFQDHPRSGKEGEAASRVLVELQVVLPQGMFHLRNGAKQRLAAGAHRAVVNSPSDICIIPTFGAQAIVIEYQLTKSPRGWEWIDSTGGKRFIRCMGTQRSPHEATSPSIAPVPFYEGATMSSHTSISQDKLSRLIGTVKTPVLIDVRTDEDFAADPRLIPGAIRRSHHDAADWSGEFAGHPAIVVCMRGEKLAQGTAAWLRHADVAAETLEGGFEGWKEAKLPLVDASKLPPRDAKGRTVWVTRARPKIDRIACPWLIRRFVDPHAVFLFVTPSEVIAVGERFSAVPFDIENVFWSHRGELCTFDVMISEFGLATPPLLRLATMVRAADTGRLDLSPEAPGLLAASLGLSRMYDDDLEQLEAGILLYDAFYRWCRDATGETHNWPTNKAKS
jgi:rhodanese-related sulfurtransferase